MSKRTNWEYDVFLASNHRNNELTITPDDILPKEHRLDFGPEYGASQEKELPLLFKQSPHSLRLTPLHLINKSNLFSKFDDFHLGHQADVEESSLGREGPISRRIQFSENDSMDFEETPMKAPPAHQIFGSNSVFKAAKMENLEEDSEESQPRRKGRAKEKGLRNLAGKSYQVMIELGKATYKQVAIKLLEEMERSGDRSLVNKEESNIKRRVYDALNVLIAMDVLKKTKKIIEYDPNNRKALTGSQLLRRKEELEDLEYRVSVSEESIARKRRVLKGLHEKRDQLARLFKRNAEINGRKCEVRKIWGPVWAVRVGRGSVGRMKAEGGKFSMGGECELVGELSSLALHLVI